ncbi:MAG: hypothetical protein ACYC54_08820 [Sedimentisphaerales bacterium]
MKKLKTDIDAIELLVKKHGNWIRDMMEQPESPFCLKNESWTISKRQEMWQKFGPKLLDEYLDIFKQVAVDVLKEPDPMFELPPEERYMASIKGKVLIYPKAMRKRLAETLALLGSRPEALKNCSTGKAETIAIISIREIFKDSDWVLWGSLNNLLPTLAEATPEEFFNAVDDALQKKPCPFDKLFAQEGCGISGANYMTGLLWALETLAWDERYLVQATVILGKLASRDPGGNWGNRPANSLATIFLPWMPQTIAPIAKRAIAIKTLQKNNPEVAWKLLLSLLPNQHQTSSGSSKPVWRKIIPDDWERDVTNKEYREQASSYADIAVDMAKGDFAKLKEMIDHLDNLTAPSFEKLLEYLESEEVINRSEEERTPLWIAIKDFTLKHKRFADAKWALGPELVAKIEQVAQKIIPQKLQNLYIRPFSKNDTDLYEERGNWEEQRKKLEESRKNAMQEIIKAGGMEAVFQFAEKVKFPDKVGYALGFIEDDIDSTILPNLFETENKNLVQFAKGFVLGRYCSQNWEWVGKLDVTKWTKTQIGLFLSYLPFEEKTWKYSKQFLGEFEVEYWKRAFEHGYQLEGDIYYAIDKLIEYHRPYAAIECLNGVLYTKKTIDKQRAIKALQAAVSSDESPHSMSGYNIVEIIKALQNDPETNQDDLLWIEWAYLPLLTGPGKKALPKLLEQKLASEPEFFCEIIRLLYRSKKEKNKPSKKPTEQKNQVAQNAWKLLHDWQTLPGKQVDGNFSADNFNIWLEEVKTKCKQSGHLDVAMITIGNVLVYYIPDPDGLWIHKTLAQALEDSEKMRNGFSTGIYNSRGVYCVDPTGKPERELADKYKKRAEDVENAGFYCLAITLRNIAKSYEHEAERNIERCDE